MSEIRSFEGIERIRHKENGKRIKRVGREIHKSICVSIFFKLFIIIIIITIIIIIQYYYLLPVYMVEYGLIQVLIAEKHIRDECQ